MPVLASNFKVSASLSAGSLLLGGGGRDFRALMKGHSPPIGTSEGVLVLSYGVTTAATLAASETYEHLNGRWPYRYKVGTLVVCMVI